MLLTIFVRSTIMEAWRALIRPLACSNACHCLTLSWRKSLSYRNQSINLQRKSMDWFLSDRYTRHKRVKCFQSMSRWSSFDTIRYINIKIQEPWYSRYYLEFIITFSLFYLFDCKSADLTVSSFFTRQSLRTWKIGCISEVLHNRAGRSALSAPFVQVCHSLKWTYVERGIHVKRTGTNKMGKRSKI